MKNKKFLRAIATLTVGAVAAAGCVSLTACGHKHTWGDYVPDGASGHYQECTGCDEHSETKPHEMANGECTVCHWTSSSSATVAVTGVELNKTQLSLKEGASETLTATVAPSNATNKAVTWAVTQGDAVTVSNGTVTAVKEGTATVTVTTQDGNKTASCVVTVTKDGGGEVTPPEELENVTVDLGDVAVADSRDAGELVAGSGVSSVGKLKVASSGGKTIIYNGNEIVSRNRINLDAGTVSEGSINKGLSIETKAAAKIIVYAHSTSGGAEAKLTMIDSSAQTVGTEQNLGVPEGNFVGVAMFDVTSAGTYSVYSSTGKAGVFYIAVVYKGFNETSTEVPAKDADCENAGNPKHYKTNYGRFYKEDGTTLVYKKADIVLDALGHDYTGVTPTQVSLPSATETGKYTAACSRNGCEHIQDIILPKLGDRSYDRTDEGAQSGNKIYTYNDATTNLTITFETTAVDADELKSSYTVDFNGSITCEDGYSTNGWTVSASGYKTLAGTVDGTSFASGVKLNSSGYVDIVLSEAATVTFYVSGNQALKWAVVTDGTAGTTTTSDAAVAHGTVYKVTITFAAGGTYRISRGANSEMALYRAVIVPTSTTTPEA